MTTNAVHNARLEAGGLLPPGATVDLPTDTVDARAFVSPAFPGRVVVRLVPDVLAAGVSAEMGELGFALQSVVDDIAIQRRRGRSFPGAAIQADPAQVGALLDLMPAFRAEARRAEQKPGHARDGFNALGERLARLSPPSLPSFWEEVGRVFIESGNLAFAASAFDRAREAEAAHSLPRDLVVEADCWLEFATAGALTVKAVQSYPRVLANSADGWARFSALCLRRSEAGLAPWASFDKDLRAAARLLGQDPKVAVEALYGELLGTSGLQKATVEQWTAMAPAFAAAIAAAPARARGLLEMVPTPPKTPDDWEARWRAYLEQTGALPALRAGHLPSGVASATFTRWLVGFDENSDERWSLFVSLLPRFQVDGAPLVLDRESWGEGAAVDADLVERCLAEGLSISPFHEDSSLALGDWVRRASADEADPFGRGTDLPHLRAHPAFAAALDAGLLREVSQSGELERALARHPALLPPYAAWLQERVERLAGLPLGALIEAIEGLTGSVGPASWPLVPGSREALGRAEVAAALHQTLTHGIFAELGWPAFEAAVAELGEDIEEDVFGPPQLALLRNGQTVIAVDADGQRARFDLKLGKVNRFRGMAWSAGQLLVTWHDDQWELRGQWTQDNQPFTDEALHHIPNEPDSAIFLADGAVSYGGPALAPGGLPRGEEAQLFGDGARAWITVHHPKTGESSLHRFDPVAGTPGELDSPAFLAGFGTPASPIVHGDCRLQALPARSALVGNDGLFGLRRRGGEDPATEDIAGNLHHGRLSADGELAWPAAWLRLPGVEAPLALSASREWGAPQRHCYLLWAGGRLLDAGGKHSASGWKTTPPERFLPNLQVRDEAGSLALRRLTLEDVTALLQAATADRGALPDDEALPQSPATAAALAARLPAVSHPGLRDGLRQLLDRAVLAERARVALLVGADQEGEEEEEDATPADGDQRYHEALGCLGDTLYYPTGDLGGELAALARFAEDGVLTGPYAEKGELSEFPWPDWLGRLSALVWLALSPGPLPEHRGILLDLASRLAAAPLLTAEDPLRGAILTFADSLSPFVQIETEDGEPIPTDDDERLVRNFWTVEGRLVRRLGDNSDRPVRLLVVGRADAPALSPPGLESVQPLPTVDRAALLAFIEAARQGGALAMDPAALALFGELAALNRVEAAYAWAGAPSRRSYDADPLGKVRREALGLKRDEFKLARDALRNADGDKLWLALAAPVPAAPARLFTAAFEDADHPARLRGAAWAAAFGQRVVLPPELLQQAERELSLDADELARVVAPATWGDWEGPIESHVDGDGDIIHNNRSDLPDVLPSLVKAIVWLAARTPGDSPLRAGLSTAVARLGARLRDPNLLLSLSMQYHGDAKEKKRARSLFEAVGGERFVPQGLRVGSTAEGRDGGLVVSVMDDDQIAFGFRPARATAADLPALRRITAYTEDREVLDAFAIATTTGFAALGGPIGAGWAADPRQSAPALVAEVEGALGLPTDAAALYLMLLALPDPTDKNVQLWTGWKAAGLKKLGAALVEKGLVVEAKRSRAGRSLFLPGGWAELRAPALPVEPAKLVLFGLEAEARELPWPSLVPAEPCGALFARAWASRVGAPKTAAPAKKGRKAGTTG